MNPHADYKPTALFHLERTGANEGGEGTVASARGSSERASERDETSSERAIAASERASSERASERARASEASERAIELAS